MLLWLIPAIVVVWSAIALVVVALCAAAAGGDRHLSPELETPREPPSLLTTAG